MDSPVPKTMPTEMKSRNVAIRCEPSALSRVIVGTYPTPSAVSPQPRPSTNFPAIASCAEWAMLGSLAAYMTLPTSIRNT